MSDLTAIESAIEKLTVDEHIEYDRYCRSNKPGLAPDYYARLYGLFLRGISCQEIVKLNKGLEIGQVLKARVEGGWDKARDKYAASLLTESGDLLRQTAAESLQFLSLMLAVVHKEQGEKLKKYLSTGDPSELGDFRISNMAGYQRLIATLAQLVGADQKKTVTHKIVGGDGKTVPVDESGEEGTGLISVSEGRWKPERGDAVREALEKTK
jgi:hypothetical protein